MRDKQCTEVWNIELILKQLCQFFAFTVLVTPVQIQCPSLYINQALLLFKSPFSKHQSISLVVLEVKCAHDTSIPSHPFAYFLNS